MNDFNPPTLADFEDLVRQMVQAENRLRPAIGTELVLRRRCSLVNGMHHVIDRVTAECRAADEQETAGTSTATVPAQRTSSTGRPVPTGGAR